MDGKLDADPAPSRHPGSKAGRNERKKLAAALLNNLSAAALAAAVVQPALATIRLERSITINDYGAVLVFGLIGLTLHAIGQVVAAGLGD